MKKKPRPFAQRKPTLRSQVRSLERLLARNTKLPDDVRKKKEADLARMRADLAKQAENLVHGEIERKLQKKYRQVKFIEKQKVVRTISKLEKSLQNTPLSSDARAKLLERCADARSDLRYIEFYPKDQKYISLFRETTDPEINKKRAVIRAQIDARERRKIHEQRRALHDSDSEVDFEDDDVPAPSVASSLSKSKQQKKRKAKNADPLLVEQDDDKRSSRPPMRSSSSSSKENSTKAKTSAAKKNKRNTGRLVDPFLVEVSESDDEGGGSSDDDMDSFASRSSQQASVRHSSSTSRKSAPPASSKPAPAKSLLKTLAKKNPSKAKEHARKAHSDPFLVNVDDEEAESSSSGEIMSTRRSDGSGEANVVNIDEYDDSSESDESGYENFSRALKAHRAGSGARSESVQAMKSLPSSAQSSESSSEASSRSSKSQSSSTSKKSKRKPRLPAKSVSDSSSDGESDPETVFPKATPSSAVEARTIQLQNERKRKARDAFLGAFEANSDDEDDDSNAQSDAGVDSDASDSDKPSPPKKRRTPASPFDALPVRKAGQKRAKVQVQVFDEVSPKDRGGDEVMPSVEPIVATREKPSKKSEDGKRQKKPKNRKRESDRHSDPSRPGKPKKAKFSKDTRSEGTVDGKQRSSKKKSRKSSRAPSNGAEKSPKTQGKLAKDRRESSAAKAKSKAKKSHRKSPNGEKLNGTPKASSDAPSKSNGTERDGSHAQQDMSPPLSAKERKRQKKLRGIEKAKALREQRKRDRKGE